MRLLKSVLVVAALALAAPAWAHGGHGNHHGWDKHRHGCHTGGITGIITTMGIAHHATGTTASYYYYHRYCPPVSGLCARRRPACTSSCRTSTFRCGDER